MAPRRLDDGGTNYRYFDVRSHVGDYTLTQSLGEGIDIGPAERPGSLGSCLHQLGLHPLDPPSLRVRGCRHEAGLAMFPLRLLTQLRELSRGTRLRLDQLAHAQPGAGLRLVVDAVQMRRL